MKEYVGFIEPKIEEQEEQGAYFLGASPVPQNPILEDDADWEESLPKEEEQNLFGIETFNCTGFNTTSQIETYEKRAFNEDNNYSDRWVGIIAGTDPTRGGNDPQLIYEAIRKYGLIPEEMLPFTSDIKNAQEYFSFNGGDKEACYKAGQEWLKRKKFMHEWVFKPNDSAEVKLRAVQTAYKYSPLAIAVSAWNKDARGLYVALGNPNHWTGSYGLQQTFYKVSDSYDPFRKLVDQELKWCKRIHIEKILTRPEIEKNNGILRAIINVIKAFFLDPQQAQEATKAIEENIIPIEPPKPVVAPVVERLNEYSFVDTSKDLPKEIINFLLWAETRSSLDKMTTSALNAIGDKNLVDKAYGCLQIRQPVVTDVNRKYGLNHKAQDCLGNLDLSVKICNLYLRMWANKAYLKREPTVQDICRTWNGGPSGWKRNSTQAYWNAIKTNFSL